jgi:hypothetical protein
LPLLRLLVCEPGRFHVRLNFFKIRDSAGRNRFDPDQVPAISGFNGALPQARFELKHCLSEAGSELFGQLVCGATPIVVLEHERISQVRGFRIFRLAGDLRQSIYSGLPSITTPAIGGKIKMTKRDGRRQREALTVFLIPELEFLAFRFVSRRYILVQ